MEGQDQILALLHDPQAEIDSEAVLKLRRSHPTCVVPMALLLANQHAMISPKERSDLQAAVILGCSDPTAIADLANLSGCDWANFYPHIQISHQHTTVETIDKFLNTYGTQNAKEDALIERLIFNPVTPDYFQGTDKPFNPEDPLELPPELDPKTEEKPAEETSPAETPSVEESNLEPTEAPEPELPSSGADGLVDKPREEPLLMESLAKIFIKQRRYERAFEIITNLSLKNPEKSAYFADQLRFLQKLIVNQQFRKRKSNE